MMTESERIFWTAPMVALATSLVGADRSVCADWLENEGCMIAAECFRVASSFWANLITNMGRSDGTWIPTDAVMLVIEQTVWDRWQTVIRNRALENDGFGVDLNDWMFGVDLNDWMKKYPDMPKPSYALDRSNAT